MKIIFAGKYCYKLPAEKFNSYQCISIGEFEDYLDYLEPNDIVISYGYGKIFKNDALKNKIFNIHPSVLPYGRGIYPILWSIYNHHPIGYTIYQINSNRIDEGLVYSSKKIKYNLDESFRELFNKITKDAEKDFILNYENYFNNPSELEVKDEKNEYYRSKKNSNAILECLKNGWDTKIKDFLFLSKNKKI